MPPSFLGLRDPTSVEWSGHRPRFASMSSRQFYEIYAVLLCILARPFSQPFSAASTSVHRVYHMRLEILAFRSDDSADARQSARLANPVSGFPSLPYPSASNPILASL